jgi:hypothetical protein
MDGASGGRYFSPQILAALLTTWGICNFSAKRRDAADEEIT